jgi:hypothetical protein
LSLAFSFSFIKNIVNHFEITKLLLDRTYRHTKGNLRLDELGGGNITASIWLLNYVTTKQLLVVVVHNNKCTTTIRFFNQVAPHCPTNVEIVSYSTCCLVNHSLTSWVFENDMWCSFDSNCIIPISHHRLFLWSPTILRFGQWSLLCSTAQQPNVYPLLLSKNRVIMLYNLVVIIKIWL